jgi:hypothetical protein
VEYRVVLDGLDDIHWSQLTHAYGSAADVPDLVRSLLSTDEKQRRGAIWALYGSIYHQGTVYEAIAAAVPFLYELLVADDVLGKSEIAGLIASIADGRGYLEVHVPGDEQYFRDRCKEEGKSLEQEMAHEATVIASVRRAATVGLRHLIPYLADPNAETRLLVALALGNYPEHASASIQPLEKVLASETNSEASQAMEESLLRLRNA